MANMRVNISINEALYNEFKSLSNEYKRVFGAKPQISSITEDAVKEYIKVMRDFLDQYKKGILTQEYMASYYLQRATEESKKVIQEVKKAKKKEK
jgi:metal-responsive CopG/Arc/MetJ family transcriptional regulator